MKPLGEMTAGELAAYVATHLGARGITVVLSGGACVTIYSEGRYVSCENLLPQRVRSLADRLRTPSLCAIPPARLRSPPVHPRRQGWAFPV